MKKMICLFWTVPLFMMSACITEVTAPFCDASNMKEIAGFAGEYYFAMDDIDIVIESKGNGFYQFFSYDDDEEDGPMSFKVCQVNSRLIIEIPNASELLAIQSAGQAQLFELNINSQTGDFSMYTLVADQQSMINDGVSYTSVADDHAVVMNEQMSATQLLGYLAKRFQMNFTKI